MARRLESPQLPLGPGLLDGLSGEESPLPYWDNLTHCVGQDPEVLVLWWSKLLSRLRRHSLSPLVRRFKPAHTMPPFKLFSQCTVILSAGAFRRVNRDRFLLVVRFR